MNFVVNISKNSIMAAVKGNQQAYIVCLSLSVLVSISIYKKRKNITYTVNIKLIKKYKKKQVVNLYIYRIYSENGISIPL